MNEDFPWFVVAMVLIAFVRWVILRLQGKSATDAFDESLFAEDEEQRQRTSEELRGSSDPTVDPNDEIRKFFEALGGQPAETKPPPPIEQPAPAPPPLPRSRSASAAPPVTAPAARTVVREKLSALEERALLHLQQEGGLQARQKRRHDVRAGVVSFRDLLGSPDRLKNAIILKEILDKPPGLRSFDDMIGHDQM